MIPAIDAKHDMARIGADGSSEYILVNARVRGYGGTPGWCLLICRILIKDGKDLNFAFNTAAETLARASRYDSGRDPDALSWLKVSHKGAVEVFAHSDAGLALDATAYAHAGHGGMAEVDKVSLWVLRDPTFDLNGKAKEFWSKIPKGEPSIAYGKMPLYEARRLIAGRIARRLPDHGGDARMTPIAFTGDSSFRIAADGNRALSKAAVAAAIASHPQSREVATAAALAGGEVVTLFQRAVPYIDLKAKEAIRHPDSRTLEGKERGEWQKGEDPA